MRLEYLPWDSSYGGAVTEVSDVCLVELGEHTAEFDNDGLPFGLCAPQKLSLTLNYTLLPSAMRSYLAYGYDTTLPPSKYLKRNSWWLWTDRGTNGATWTLEFVGCEETTEGVDLEPSAGDTYNYKVELVDVVYHAMKTVSGADSIGAGMAPATVNGYAKLFNILVTDRGGCNVYQQGASNQMVAADNLMAKFADAISDVVETYYIRTGSTLANVTIGSIFTSALELRKSGVTTIPRRQGDVLTESTIYALWKTDVAAGISGGLSSAIDKYSWAREDATPWDVMHDLCETLGVKMAYTFGYVSAFNMVTVDFKPRRVGSTLTHGDSNTNTYDVRIGSGKMLERAKIIKRGSGIAKAEVQFESEYDEDARAVVRLVSGARGSRSMNVEPIIHNIPTYLTNVDDNSRGRYSPVVQTNNLYWQRTETGAAGTFVLCHENTRYRYLPGPSGAYVQATTTSGETPIAQREDNENFGEYRMQLNAIQTQGTMQSALAKFAVFVFGAEQNGIIETSWSLLHTTEAMPDKLGAVHDLSYAQDGGTGGTSYLATDFPEMDWGRCILTKSAVNYVEGTVAVTYYLLSRTGNYL